MTTRPRLHCTKHILTLDVPALAQALWVTEEAVLEEFRDGRVASRWAEWWGDRLSELTKSTNTNEPGYDLSGTYANADIAVSNKTLTPSGVKFQKSVYVGSGRSCSQDDLIRSLLEAELYQIVDITSIPDVALTTVASRLLVAKARETLPNGRFALTPSGWNAAQFYAFLNESYVVTTVRHTAIQAPTPLEALNLTLIDSRARASLARALLAQLRQDGFSDDELLDLLCVQDR